MRVTFSLYECRVSIGDTARWWGHSNPIAVFKRFALSASQHSKMGTISREL